MVLPGCYTTVILSLTMIVIPISVNDLRTSMLLKRMGSSPVKPIVFLMTIIVYYYIVVFVSYIWQILWSYLILWNYRGFISDMLTGANYLYLWYAITLTYVMSLSIGFIWMVVCRRNFQIQLISIAVIVVSFVLGGLGVPIGVVHNVTTGVGMPLLTKVVYVDPFWYTSCLNYQAWFAHSHSVFNIYGSSMFDPSTLLTIKLGTSFAIVDILGSFDKYMALFMPVGITFALGVLDIATFRWNRRD
ncbi:MAG: hypothetical protein LBV37_01145 [Mycoplasmataceae bacterium]|nr:hypothetical protein [Mycoplasmataceae bacterium]